VLAESSEIFSGLFNDFTVCVLVGKGSLGVLPEIQGSEVMPIFTPVSPVCVVENSGRRLHFDRRKERDR
jgi:hypothetical protein